MATCQNIRAIMASALGHKAVKSNISHGHYCSEKASMSEVCRSHVHSQTGLFVVFLETFNWSDWEKQFKLLSVRPT